MAAPTLERCEGIKRNLREHSAHSKHRRRPQPAAAPAPVGTLHPVGTELVAHHEYARVLTEETGDTYTLATGSQREDFVVVPHESQIEEVQP